jgi:hypothetical protein
MVTAIVGPVSGLQSGHSRRYQSPASGWPDRTPRTAAAGPIAVRTAGKAPARRVRRGRRGPGLGSGPRRSPRRSPGIVPEVPGAASGPARWLSLCLTLVRSRSLANADRLSTQVRYARDRWWTWLRSPRKRVKGQPFRGFKSHSTATDLQRHRSWQSAGGRPGILWSHLTVSFMSCGLATAGISRSCCAWSRDFPDDLNRSTHAAESCTLVLAAVGNRPPWKTIIYDGASPHAVRAWPVSTARQTGVAHRRRTHLIRVRSSHLAAPWRPGCPAWVVGIWEGVSRVERTAPGLRAPTGFNR